MKNRMLLFVCLMMLLLLSACQIHIDTDPWPASPDYVDATPAIGPELTATPVDEPESTIQPADTMLLPDVTATPEPNDAPVDPGFNG